MQPIQQALLSAFANGVQLTQDIRTRVQQLDQLGGLYALLLSTQ